MRLAYIELHKPPAVLAIDCQRLIAGIKLSKTRLATIQYFEAANEVVS